jgi:type II secretory pathway pseudopilin PulG
MSSRAQRAARGEGGFAMVTVMLAMLMLTILAVSVTAFAVGSQNLSRRDQNWNAALAAAEAGFDDFVFRLNQSSTYYQSIPTYPSATTWTAVPGAASPASFRYSIRDPNELATKGTLTLVSSGKVGNASRTVEAKVRRRSFIDYLYFTDFETMDASLYPNPSSSITQSQAQSGVCSHHYYDGRDTNCIEITFASFDVINGPLHSNDAYRICPGAQFNGSTSTSWQGSGGVYYRAVTGCGSGSPVFANPGDPRYADPLTMPPSNTAILNETRPYDGVGGGGCLYTGPTSITFNSTGTITVDSPFSKNTSNTCPVNTWNGTGTKPAAATGNLPSNGVIYVQDVPASSTDVNYTSGCPYSVRYQNSSSNPLRVHPLGYPQASDITPYNCRSGDVFVSGTMKGQATIAATNNIDVVGNLMYVGDTNGLGEPNGSDLLGLVANNFVEVYHPVNSSGTNLPTAFTSCSSPTAGPSCAIIDAAILSVQHSMRVQNYNRGAALGTLTINGAFAQRFRGIVGTFSNGTLNSGYAKGYSYDQRLKYLSPPKFLDPVASSFQIATWAELKPVWCGTPAFTTACP